MPMSMPFLEENLNMIAGTLITISVTYCIRLKQNMLRDSDDNEWFHYHKLQLLKTLTSHECMVNLLCGYTMTAWRWRYFKLVLTRQCRFVICLHTKLLHWITSELKMTTKYANILHRTCNVDETNKKNLWRIPS